MLTVSIVTHGHGNSALEAVSDALRSGLVRRVILIMNIDENLLVPQDERLIVLKNLRPKGFSANHNHAFSLCETEFFCVVNPDVRFDPGLFDCLLSAFRQPVVAVCAPLIFGPTGILEDSARVFPTVPLLLRKLLFSYEGRFPNKDGDELQPDWVAGVFMMFRSSVFREIRGFDDGFYMYYEDVDICRRIWRNGNSVNLCKNAKLTHFAQRESRRRLRLAIIHARSMARYLLLTSLHNRKRSSHTGHLKG